MTVEYILLLSLFATMVMSALITGPHTSFKEMGPKLGARVEKHLITGDGFGDSTGSGVSPLKWE